MTSNPQPKCVRGFEKTPRIQSKNGSLCQRVRKKNAGNRTLCQNAPEGSRKRLENSNPLQKTHKISNPLCVKKRYTYRPLDVVLGRQMSEKTSKIRNPWPKCARGFEKTRKISNLLRRCAWRRRVRDFWSYGPPSARRFENLLPPPTALLPVTLACISLKNGLTELN